MGQQGGKFRHRIVRKAVSTATDAHGQVVQTWPSTTETLYASFEPLDGDERITGEQFDGRKQFRMQFRTGLTSMSTDYRKDEFTFRSRTFYPIDQDVLPAEKPEIVQLILVENI